MLVIMTGDGNGGEEEWRDTPARMFEAMQSRSQEKALPLVLFLEH
jgi:hypothetical protein